MSDDLFAKANITLFRECFEGRPEGQTYTWFVEKKEGLFDALDSVSAERASARPSPTCATFAAHANHVLFALQETNSYLGRPKPEGNWESSWQREVVLPEEWEELKAKTREEYAFLLAAMEAGQDSNDEETVIGLLAQTPHMAFHLGAMRQIMKLI